MKNTRLAGHGLIGEGKALGTYSLGVSGPGRGGCSCGARSGYLESSGKRRAWHASHKDEVRNQAASDPTPSLQELALQAATQAVGKMQNVPFPGTRQKNVARAAVEAYLEAMVDAGEDKPVS